MRRDISSSQNNIKLPDKPKFRSLVNKAAANFQLPYVIEKNSSAEDKIDYLEDLVVGLGHLKYKSTLTYAARYGENIHTAVSKCIWVLFASAANDTIQKQISQGAEDLMLHDLEKKTDERGEYVDTPFGKLYGDIEEFIINLAVFILTQYGRIIDEGGDGTYVYQPITEEQIFHSLDPGVIFDVDSDGTPYLLEIFEIAGLWDAKKISDKLDNPVEEKN
jgi:hypothetical protein